MDFIYSGFICLFGLLSLITSEETKIFFFGTEIGVLIGYIIFLLIRKMSDK